MLPQLDLEGMIKQEIVFKFNLHSESTLQCDVSASSCFSKGIHDFS